MSEAPTYCRNCRTPLAGEYCSACGQREGRKDLYFADLAGEVLGDFLHWDSRVWRTILSLLFRPGNLTAEFIAGRRARFVPPLRLYLIISFLTFLSLSLGSGLEMEAGGAKTSGAVDETGVKIVVEDESDAGSIDLADETSPLWMQDLDARLERNVVRIKDDPNDFIQQLQDYLPQMMFLLLPLFALLLQFSYLLSPFHYLQHLVFALHFHSFAYLLYLLAYLLERFAWHSDGLTFLLLIYLPLALRRCYGSGLGAAVGKSFFLLLSYIIFLALGFSAMAVAVMALM